MWLVINFVYNDSEDRGGFWEFPVLNELNTTLLLDIASMWPFILQTSEDRMSWMNRLNYDTSWEDVSLFVENEFHEQDCI